MPSIKEYKAKISGLKNTEKMTRTMKLVSASKLRLIHHLQANGRNYEAALSSMIGRIAGSVDRTSHPLLTPAVKVNKILILAVTSDKGLCGSFNHNLHKKILTWLKERGLNPKDVGMSFCGKKGYMFFRNRTQVKNYYEGVTARPAIKQAQTIGQELSRLFLSGEYQEVYLAYNRFNSPLSQTPVIEKFLPIDPETIIKEKVSSLPEYIFEPGQAHLLAALIEAFFNFKIFYTLLENSAGEHGARMMAMDKASQSAKDLIGRYTLLRNRARQATITKELIEIVSGAEALKKG